MTPSAIEPATFRFVAQRLNHCATAVPLIKRVNYIVVLVVLLLLVAVVVVDRGICDVKSRRK